MREIAEIAEQQGHGIRDEVYRGLEHEGSYSVPSIADIAIYEKGVSTSSMSKVYCLQVAQAWMGGSGMKSFIKECFKHRDYNIISCMIDDALANKCPQK